MGTTEDEPLATMTWKTKARITRTCAQLPGAERWYRLIQAHFGRLKGNPESRLAATLEMVALLRKHELPLQGRYMEVGTGHVPVVPLGLFLAGARDTWTFDLNRRLDPEMTLRALAWIAEHEDYVASTFAPFVNDSEVRTRLRRLRGITDLTRLLEAARIHYAAPADAAKTGLPDHSIDCHFSVTTLEHITPGTVGGIFREARRVLAADGVALHFIDPSDHFAHTDKSISQINFLRFTEAEWQRIAGNRFAYCNRLRASDYARVFSEAELNIADEQRVVDPHSVALLQQAFPVDMRFIGYAETDLCTTRYNVLLKLFDPV
jgi:hypothetical protein